MAIIKVKTGGITADAVTDALIADDVVGTEHLTANEVDTAALKADAVTGAELADNAVNSEHYTDGSIDTAHIADGQVTVGKLATAVLTGATDIGAAIADADLLLVDDGAGGTLRKTAASRLKTYVGVPDMKVVGVWRLTAGQDLAVNGQVIANSWEEADNNYERTGSGVTESGGVFTVPESGKYLITANVQFNTASAQAYAGAYIQYTTNGSNFVTHAQMIQSVTDETAQQYASASTQLYLDAAIAANYKVRLITTGATGNLSFNGDTNRNDTYIVFMKLADT